MDLICKLLSHARDAEDLDTQVVAGVVGVALRANRTPLIRGLSEDRFQKLLDEFFVGMALDNGHADADQTENNEFADLLELLLEHRAEASEPAAWLAHAVASAAMGENHLWQDMGLPSRRHLSAFMQSRFGSLAALNGGDMKWKKFFYRQLCLRAQIPLCKSPNCAGCSRHPPFLHPPNPT